MDENKLKAIVEEALDKAIEPLKQMLEDPDTGLKRLNDRMDANTAAVVKLESTINGYGDMYKINVSPEFHLEPLSEAA